MQEREPEEVQEILVKDWRKSTLDKNVPGLGRLTQPRIVRIARSWRPRSATVSYRSVEESPIAPTDHQHRHLTSDPEPEIDQAEVSRSLQTARKGGASQAGVNVEQRYYERGADGTKLSKDGGFKSSAEKVKIRKIRRENGRLAESFLRFLHG